MIYDHQALGPLRGRKIQMLIKECTGLFRAEGLQNSYKGFRGVVSGLHGFSLRVLGLMPV